MDPMQIVSASPVLVRVLSQWALFPPLVWGCPFLLPAFSSAGGLALARVGGSHFFLFFSFLSFHYCLSPALLSDLHGLSTPHAVDPAQLSSSDQLFSFLYPMFSLHLHIPHPFSAIRYAITFDRDFLGSIGKVCRVLVFTLAWVFALPPSLGLSLLAVLIVDMSLVSLISSTWWMRSERDSLLDDGVFLPSIFEALFGSISGVRWVDGSCGSWGVAAAVIVEG